MMLYRQVWISILNLLTIPTTAKLNARAASPSASSSSSAQLMLANEAAAATSYNPNDLLPTQLSALYLMLQDTPTATPSLITQAISYDAGSFTPAAVAVAATSLSDSLAAEQSTAIIIPPPINNPLTAAPPPEATSSPFLYFGSDIPINGYYVLPTATSAPYPIANASTGLGISPGNVSGIVPFTGKGCGRWEMGFRWQGAMIMIWSAVVVLGRVFL